MAEALRTSFRTGSPAERVERRLNADFPAVDVPLGERPEDLRDAEVRAVAVLSPAVPEPLPPDTECFWFPADAPCAGLSVLFRSGDRLLRALRAFYLPPVVLAGAGPGGAELMTVAARRAVAKADVVLSDCLCGSEVLAGLRPEAVCVAVGKRCGSHTVTQEQICRRLVTEAVRGRRVVRLKGGDPAVFGRLEEETRALREAGLPYRVLPGVGAASCAAAFVGESLTAREVASEIIFSTGRLAGGGNNPFPLNGPAPAIALYMSRDVLAERMANLLSAGYRPETPAVIVEKLGSPGARAVAATVSTLAAAADAAGVGTPAVVLVGAHLGAPAHLPLSGVRIWLPAEKETAESHREALEDLGAVTTIVPLIEPVPLPFDAAATFGRRFDWVVFTSKKSVDFLFAALSRHGLDARWLPRVASFPGPTTEKLRERGIVPELIPPEPTRVSLGSSLAGTGLAGMRVLIASSAVAPDHLRQALTPHAAEVVRLDLYTLRYPRVNEIPAADVVLFSSESTVLSAQENGLLPAIRERGLLIGGIGPATGDRLRTAGLSPAIVPDGTTPAALAYAVRRHFARARLVAEGLV